MLTLSSPIDMRQQVLAWHAAGQTVAFVPTMGALHDGHMSLVRGARERAGRVVVSIFVNPTQFGPHEDFARYPRPLEDDLALCRTAHVDAVFTPTTEAIYPPGTQTTIEVTGLGAPLCGRFRPGHFRGVATVVYTLFHHVPAQMACFGEKDYQQLKLIERMVTDCHLPIQIVGLPIVREPDGLAMSSRNKYLAPAERQQATALYRALQRMAALATETADHATIIAAGRAILSDAGITRIDYLEVVDGTTLLPPPSPRKTSDTVRGYRACVAAHVGTTRLIDNLAM